MEPITPVSSSSHSPNGASPNYKDDIGIYDDNVYLNQYFSNNMVNGFSIELIPKGSTRNYFSNAYPPKIGHLVSEETYQKLIKKLNKAYFPLYLYITTTILIIVSIGSIYPFILYHDYSLDLTCTLLVILNVVTLYMIYRTFYPSMIKNIIKKNILERLDKFNKKNELITLSLEVKEGEQYGKTKDNITVKITVHPQKSMIQYVTPKTPQQPPTTPMEIVSIPIAPPPPPPFILNPLPTSPLSLPETPQTHGQAPPLVYHHVNAPIVPIHAIEISEPISSQV
ncbi:hypothetical protein DICPUDRAFT_82455 [Dictyostelium purpureum]|uniref:Uncharacterized protein n=1 Tax=Dictyostelium purpureum TaxID=5786 RepID=F0ZWK2_DICPU|nr:uncharacterized protein DICPUDRAFT_82455 [Dictyostelium purpureum]EGC31672.1 hypothetical protein DICPUDRAFT_82455 [Dictyostelium purpureum]|eukprot:XP_003291803.1 hypothetical protein DICPUDRAFT_82455 [Dictyostelium purpureum]